MFKRFLIVFMTVCSFMMGADLEKYRLYVKDIDTEVHAVALTNGLVCNLIQKDWGMEKSLEIGEEVQLMLLQRNIEQKEPKQETGELCLITLGENRKKVRIWVTEESKLNAPSYVSLSTVVVQPAGWFSSEVTQKIVELSDGSKWEIDEDWQEEFPQGNHVFVSVSSNGQWYLTNLDKVAILERHSWPDVWNHKDYLINHIMLVKSYEAVSN
jgi:hypothetical protein